MEGRLGRLGNERVLEALTMALSASQNLIVVVESASKMGFVYFGRVDI